MATQPPPEAPMTTTSTVETPAAPVLGQTILQSSTRNTPHPHPPISIPAPVPQSSGPGSSVPPQRDNPTTARQFPPHSADDPNAPPTLTADPTRPTTNGDPGLQNQEQPSVHSQPLTAPVTYTPSGSQHPHGPTASFIPFPLSPSFSPLPINRGPYGPNPSAFHNHPWPSVLGNHLHPGARRHMQFQSNTMDHHATPQQHPTTQSPDDAPNLGRGTTFVPRPSAPEQTQASTLPYYRIPNRPDPDPEQNRAADRRNARVNATNIITNPDLTPTPPPQQVFARSVQLTVDESTFVERPVSQLITPAGVHFVQARAYLDCLATILSTSSDSGKSRDARLPDGVSPFAGFGDLTVAERPAAFINAILRLSQTVNAIHPSTSIINAMFRHPNDPHAAWRACCSNTDPHSHIRAHAIVSQALYQIERFHTASVIVSERNHDILASSSLVYLEIQWLITLLNEAMLTLNHLEYGLGTAAAEAMRRSEQTVGALVFAFRATTAAVSIICNFLQCPDASTRLEPVAVFELIVSGEHVESWFAEPVIAQYVRSQWASVVGMHTDPADFWQVLRNAYSVANQNNRSIHAHTRPGVASSNANPFAPVLPATQPPPPNVNATQRQSDDDEDQQRLKPCLNWEAGFCRWGERCDYAHPLSLMRACGSPVPHGRCSHCGRTQHARGRCPDIDHHHPMYLSHGKLTRPPTVPQPNRKRKVQHPPSNNASSRANVANVETDNESTGEFSSTSSTSVQPTMQSEFTRLLHANMSTINQNVTTHLNSLTDTSGNDAAPLHGNQPTYSTKCISTTEPPTPLSPDFAHSSFIHPEHEFISQQVVFQVDSATDCNTTNNIHILADYVRFDTPRAVQSADGSNALAYGHGNAHIQFTDGNRTSVQPAVLHTLYVPGFSRNFINSTSLRTSSGFDFDGDGHTCTITYSATQFRTPIHLSHILGQEYVNAIAVEPAVTASHVDDVIQLIKDISVNSTDSDLLQSTLSSLNRSQLWAVCNDITTSTLNDPAKLLRDMDERHTTTAAQQTRVVHVRNASTLNELREHRVHPIHIFTPQTITALCDSGANRSCFNSLSVFSTYTKFKVPIKVFTAANSFVLAYGAGTVCSRFRDPRTSTTIERNITNSLYTPDFTANYIDATSLRRDHGLVLHGSALGLTYTDPTTQTSISVTERDGQEYFTIDVFEPKTPFVRAVNFNQPHQLLDSDNDSDKTNRRRLTNLLRNLSVAELTTIANRQNPTPHPHVMTATRLALARLGHYTYEVGATDKLLRLHHLLGHASMRITAEYAKQNGINLGKVGNAFCWHCIQRKTTHEPAKKVNPHQTYTPFSHFNMDISGPHADSSYIGRSRYALICVEAYSGKMYTYYMPDLKNIPKHLTQFLTDVRCDMIVAGVTTPTFLYADSTLTTDGAKYFHSAEFLRVIRSFGLRNCYSAPYHSWQNGRAERAIRTINTRYRSMMTAANVDKSYWELAHRYCVLTFNSTPNFSNPHNQSPILRLTGKPPDLSKLNAFGTQCASWLPPKSAARRTMTDDGQATVQATYLGWDQVQNAHVLAKNDISNMNRWIFSYSITAPVLVPKPMADNGYINLEDDGDCPSNYTQPFSTPTLIPEPAKPDEITPEPIAIPPSVNPASQLARILRLHASKRRRKACHDPPIPSVASTEASPGPSPPADPLDIPDFTAVKPDSTYHVNVAQARQEISYTLKAARQTKYGAGYDAAMEKELNGMFKTGALKPISINDVKPDEKIHRSLMMYYPKFTTRDGSYVLDKLKCRLVFFGKDQVQGTHYDMKASSSPRNTTIRTFFGISPPSTETDTIQQSDVTQAFLRANQSTPGNIRIIMRLPKDLRRYRPDGSEEVYLVERAVYGQVNASLLWQNTFASWATDEAGFQRSTVDPCIFYKQFTNPDGTTITDPKTKAPIQIIMLLYTDDIAVRGPQSFVTKATRDIYNKWGCKSEDCEYYLGMRVARDHNGNISLSQQHYISDLVDLYGVTTSNDVPMTPGTTVFKNERANYNPDTPKRKAKPNVAAVHVNNAQTERELPLTHDMMFTNLNATKHNNRPLLAHEVTFYQQLIGALLYVTNTTRPDIAAAVATLGTVFIAPRLTHWKQALGILAYLKKTANYALRFTPSQPPHTTRHDGVTPPWYTYTANEIYAFVDAAYADSALAASRTGWVVMFNGAPVAWRSKTQTITTQSTMESEVVAACDITNEIRFLRALLFEFYLPQRKPTRLYEDNVAAQIFGKSVSVTDRNKHMVNPCNTDTTDTSHTEFDRSRQLRVDYYAIKRAVQDGIIDFLRVDTSLQLADCFTKNLALREHALFSSALLQPLNLSLNPITSSTQQTSQLVNEHLHGPNAIPNTHNNITSITLSVNQPLTVLPSIF